jgi:hypothetical protein
VRSGHVVSPTSVAALTLAVVLSAASLVMLIVGNEFVTAILAGAATACLVASRLPRFG